MHVLYAGAMHATKTLLIVYHSHTGGTRQMVEAAVAGAQAQDVFGAAREIQQHQRPPAQLCQPQ